MVAATPENVDRIRAWTPVDEDLDGVPADIARVAMDTRKNFGLGVDSHRCKVWNDPEDVVVYADVPYLDDGTADTARGKAHCLDVYLPHDALLRGGSSLPAYIDIHGGGFVYGYKDLNRNFGTRLATKGFAVFSLGYRLAPTADFMDELRDLFAAIDWIARHAADYPINPTNVFITGDSAGATLGLYVAAALADASLATHLGLDVPEMSIKGAVFQSGLFDVSSITAPKEPPSVLPYIDAMGGTFFRSFVERMPANLITANGMAEQVELPPVMLTTSSDDFLEFESLLFGAYMRMNGKRCEIHDFVPSKGRTLGHVFPVGQTWIEESRHVLDLMTAFAYDLSDGDTKPTS